MSDVVKINEIGLANIIKLNEIEAANIVKVNEINWGGGAPVGPTFCDEFGGVNENFDTYLNGEQPVTRFSQLINNDPTPDISYVSDGVLYYRSGNPPGGESPASGVTDYYRAIYRNNHRLVFAAQTDFDIQIDFLVEFIGGRANTEGPVIRLGYERIQSGSLSNWVQIQNSHVGTVFNARTEPSAILTYTQALANSGKLRLVYDHVLGGEGGETATVSFYYDIGGGWQLINTQNADPNSTAGARPYIEFHCSGSIGNEGYLWGSVDNFIVNDCVPESCDVLRSPDDDFESGVLNEDLWIARTNMGDDPVVSPDWTGGEGGA
jgi:hypothetical protein